MMGGGIVQKGVGALSGGDRIAIECIKRWARHHEIHVFTGKAGYISHKRYNVKGVNWHLTSTYISFRDRLIHILLFSIQALTIGLIKSLLMSGPKGKAIIYSSDFLPELLPALILRKRFGSPLICTFYLFAPSPFSQQIFEMSHFLRVLLLYNMQKFAYILIRKHADMVFVTNQLDRSRFIDDRRLTPDRVVAVQGGVDTEAPALVPDPPSKYFDAVFIGRLHPQKGIIQLIDIWKKVCSAMPRAKLAVIGAGQLEEKVKDKIRNLALEDNVVLLGFVDGVEKIGIFKASKIVVHPAIYDSGGMAACEAMSCGLPGVSFDLPSLKTYYPQGMLKTPRYDFEAFARNIVSLLTDADLYKKMSKEALELALKWDWNSKAEVILSQIEKALT